MNHFWKKLRLFELTEQNLADWAHAFSAIK